MLIITYTCPNLIISAMECWGGGAKVLAQFAHAGRQTPALRILKLMLMVLNLIF
ncbi:MAG: hypothetical protein ACNYPF_05465 [Candidatus Puniceispirillales bacterium WSBS_2018_MAG_OTU23]